jgi:hypothetical protein
VPKGSRIDPTRCDRHESLANLHGVVTLVQGARKGLSLGLLTSFAAAAAPLWGASAHVGSRPGLLARSRAPSGFYGEGNDGGAIKIKWGHPVGTAAAPTRGRHETRGDQEDLGT